MGFKNCENQKNTHLTFSSTKPYKLPVLHTNHCTKKSIKDFFSKCSQIGRFLWILSHLQKKFLIENLTFCAVTDRTSHATKTV